MVALVGVGDHHVGRVGVRAGDDQRRDAADVGGQPGRDEVADRPRGRQQHLAAHVPALLLARRAGPRGARPRRPASIIALVELEDVQVAAEAGLHVGDDRDHPVDLVVAVGVVDLVGAQERAVDRAHDLGDAVDRVQALVGVHLAREVGVGRDLPAGEVDRLQPGADLLDGLVAGARAERGDVRAVVQQVPELLGAVARERVLDADGPPQLVDGLVVVGPLDAFPALGHVLISWTSPGPALPWRVRAKRRRAAGPGR